MTTQFCWLSGGYEDDVDYGNEFTYTGSGGRDLSGNKRTAEQSCDQTLTRENKLVNILIIFFRVHVLTVSTYNFASITALFIALLKPFLMQEGMDWLGVPFSSAEVSHSPFAESALRRRGEVW